MAQPPYHECTPPTPKVLLYSWGSVVSFTEKFQRLWHTQDCVNIMPNPRWAYKQNERLSEITAEQRTWDWEVTRDSLEERALPVLFGQDASTLPFTSRITTQGCDNMWPQRWVRWKQMVLASSLEGGKEGEEWSVMKLYETETTKAGSDLLCTNTYIHPSIPLHIW